MKRNPVYSDPSEGRAGVNGIHISTYSIHKENNPGENDTGQGSGIKPRSRPVLKKSDNIDLDGRESLLVGNGSSTHNQNDILSCNQTVTPSNQGGNLTVIPPNQGGNQTVIPPHRGDNRTVVPPNQGGNLTVIPPYEGDDMQRESLKVTNGEVCVGDIIIENGFRNPGFENADGVQQNPKGITTNLQNTQSDTKIGSNGTIPSTNGDVIHKLKRDSLVSSTDQVSLLKDELDRLKASTEDENDGYVKDSSSHQNENENSKDAEDGKENGKGVGNDTNDWPDIDDIALTKDIENDNKLPNGKPHGNGHIPNGIVSNGHTGKDANGDINQNHKSSKKSSQKAKSERKGSKKKVKERKNSLPDHVLNSLNKKPSKPILIPTMSNGFILPEGRKDSIAITEQKNVTFSNDTVFNENKPNKYRKERLNTRKNSKDIVMATANPVFVDDDGFEISLTDDEKALRYLTEKDHTGNGVNTFYLFISFFFLQICLHAY